MTTQKHVSGTIKALEWRGADPDYSRADCEFGCYEIINTHHDTGHVLHLAGSKSAEYHPTNAEAKAAAQADYAAHILAAIQPDPEPVTKQNYADDRSSDPQPQPVTSGIPMLSPAEPQPVADWVAPDWIWYCETADGEPIISLGRWPRNGHQKRYKIAEIQPVEHDHPATPSSAGTVSVEAAAKVLLDACPNPIFDQIKPVLMGEVTERVDYTDEEGNEAYYDRPVSWGAMKEIIRAALRSIAGDNQ